MQDLLDPGPVPDALSPDTMSPDAVSLVVVGFSAPADVAALAAHLGLRGPVLADPDRALYRLLGLPRAPVWQVYSPATLARYARAAFRGTHFSRPGGAEGVEDTGSSVGTRSSSTGRWCGAGGPGPRPTGSTRPSWLQPPAPHEPAALVNRRRS